MVRATKTISSKCGAVTLVLSLLFLFVALLCAFFRQPLKTIVDGLIQYQTSISPDSMMTGLWMNPPLTPKLEVYIYNVTNAEPFLNGSQPLKVVEIGPYVYAAPQAKKVLKWSTKGEKVTFQSKTTYLSENQNGLSDLVVVPNLLVFGGMLKNEVKPQGDFIKKSVIWPILTSTGKKSPFITLTVQEFLWGYEDELACLNSQKQDENEDFFQSDPSDDFFGEKDEEKPAFGGETNYRRKSDGKCIFGALSGRNDTFGSAVTMLTGGSQLSQKGQILEVGNSNVFGIWQSGSKCDSLSGTREPSSLPPVDNLQEFDMLMGIMCRSIKMEFQKLVDYGNVKTNRFVMSPKTFEKNAPENKCYGSNSELPDGIFSVEKCVQGVPMAVSLPHFLYADEWYRNQVEGISAPDPNLHELYLDIEPHLGGLVSARARFQINLVIHPDPAFEPLAHLTNVTVLPIFWVTEGYAQLPSNSMQKLQLALMLPNLFANGLIIFCVIIGVILLLWTLVKGAKNILAEQQMYKFKSGKSSEKQNENKTLYNPLPYTEDIE